MNVKIADTVFEINNKYDYIKKRCREYTTSADADYSIEVSDDEITAEDTGERAYSQGYLESLAVYRKISECLLKKNTLLFHCSALALDGEAYLFTAPSGTGKSTHARLWREHFGDRVVMINDDKPVLSFTDERIAVWGTPYCGKHSLQTNMSADVKGIVILHQAPVNSITRLTPHDAFPLLLGQSFRTERPDEIIKIMGLVQRLCSLPIFSMGCTISDEAVMTAYNALKGKVQNDT